ncbi:MAG: 16S rRNA (cytidine(1402)-2'-O)-methyltransferase [Anaerolineae bacterium]
MGTLYLVGTPIGNLEDITLRALRVLRQADLIACEDTRHTGRLLAHYGIERPLLSYFDAARDKPARIKRILAALERGDVALVSDAGTPGLSDPGYELVQAALARGIEVVSIPGPSALTAALSASGLPTGRFLFVGFLPRKRGERRQVLAEVKDRRETLVFFEAPHRLRGALADATDILGPERRVALCRELTKRFEEVWRGTLAEAQAVWGEREPRGEFTLVVGGAPEPAAWGEDRVRAAMRRALAAGVSRSEAARRVARESGWAKGDVYGLDVG